jgi:vitamin B12 transporter
MTRSLPLAAVALVAALAVEARAQAPAAGRDTLDWFHAPRIVVTANRGETPAAEVASSISAVDREQIERRRYRSALDALRDLPGVQVVGGGGAGGVTSVFLRGADSRHTLVLVDGVEMNDPSSPTGAYDFALLPAHDVERIEVLRGPQSTLYGSAATAGVIQVFTRGGGGPARMSLEAEAGSADARHFEASASGEAGPVRAFASASRRSAGGISATAPRLGGVEADGFESTSFAGRADWRAAEAAALGLVVRLRRDDVDLDQGGFAGADDPNFASRAEELSARLEGRLELLDGRWSQTLAATLARHDRSTRDEPDPARPEDRSTGAFDGARWRLEWLHRLELTGGRVSAGVETEVERARSRFESESAFGPFESVFPEESARTTGAWVQHEGRRGGTPLAWSVGARLDAHERFGTAATWRVAPVLSLGGQTRLRATWGTGFLAPTLFQLFDPQFGDPELDAEESRGWDAGLERDLFDGRARIAAAWFSTRFDDLIAFEFPDGYRNAGAARAEGVEATASAWPAESVRLAASYTHTRTEGPDGEELLRRPRHRAEVTLAWDPGAAALAVTARYVGDREDLDFSAFPAERVTLDAYTVVRVAAAWRIDPRLELFGRLENALDESYEEVLGFGAPGRALHLGLGVDL